MKFEHEGLSYEIEFARTHKVPAGSIAGKARTYTTARVLQVEGKRVIRIIREYEVGVCHRDRFTYEEGRKAALAMALYDAPTVKGGEPIIGKRLSKDFKTAVWRAYHQRPGSPIKWVEPSRD